LVVEVVGVDQEMVLMDLLLFFHLLLLQVVVVEEDLM
jgi:hypothetical protein